MSRPIIDLAGQKHGRLTVIRAVGRRHRSVLWECLCDCGNKCRALGPNIAQGSTRSCGCVRREQAKLNALRSRRGAANANSQQQRRKTIDEIFDRPARSIDRSDKAWHGAEDAAAALESLWR